MGDFTQVIEEALRVEEPIVEAPAGEAPEQQKHPSWNRTLKTCPAPRAALEPAVGLEDAQEMILPKLEKYKTNPAPSHALVVVAPPGTGKTTAAVRLAEEVAAERGRVLYAGPRHDFFADLIRIARHPDWWYEWLPRQQVTKEKPDIVETCQLAGVINGSWLNKGYRGIDFCSSICGWDYVNGACEYHAQKLRRERIIFGQHQHVWGGHPLEFSFLIGDESPFGAFQHPWAIPGKHVIPADLDPREPIAELVQDVHSLILQGSQIEGPALLMTLGGPTHVREVAESVFTGDAILPLAPRIYNIGDAERASYFHLPSLARLLLREAKAAEEGRDYPHRVILTGGYLLLLLRHRVSEQMPRHIVWLDATGNKHLYETVLGRPVEMLEPRVQMRGRVFQIYDRANGKGAVVDGKGEAKSSVRDLKKQVDKIAEQYNRVGVITHQAIEGQFAEYPDRGHYYSARGTNRFEGCDALVLVGIPQPPLFRIDRAARMLFSERMTPFKLDNAETAPWTTIDKPYAYVAEDGLGRAYPASGFWGDPDLTAVLWQMREAEIIQAAHRARPNRYDIDIWLLENLPIDELPPDQLMPIRDIFSAVQEINCFEWPEVMTLADVFWEEGQPLPTGEARQSLGLQELLLVRTDRLYSRACAKEVFLPAHEDTCEQVKKPPGGEAFRASKKTDRREDGDLIRNGS